MDLDDSLNASEPVALAGHVRDEPEISSGVLHDLLDLLLVEPVDELLVGIEVDQDGGVLNYFYIVVDILTLEVLFVVDPNDEVGDTVWVL